MRAWISSAMVAAAHRRGVIGRVEVCVMIMTVVLFAHAPASAEELVVYIPGVTGDYLDPDGLAVERSSSFSFDYTLNSITEVRAELTGLHTSSFYIWFGLRFEWNTQFTVEVYDSVAGTGYTRSIPAGGTGPFTEVGRLGTLGSANWSFLHDGMANIRVDRIAYGSPGEGRGP